jgi:DNA-binding MarR family transcriptional regulator
VRAFDKVLSLCQALVMSAQHLRTPEGDAATEVVLNTFRSNGVFLAAGDVLAAEEGLTAARWQVLGALALAERALTVPQIARRMGLTRQAVQVSINRLRSEGLVESDENPDHRRSPLIRMSELGAARYAALDRRQIDWINDLASGFRRSELATAARVLQELSKRLEAKASNRRKEN